jgi:hypothetical protein
MFRNFISHNANCKPIKTPSESITISLLGCSKKIEKSYGDVTLVHLVLMVKKKKC